METFTVFLDIAGASRQLTFPGADVTYPLAVNNNGLNRGLDRGPWPECGASSETPMTHTVLLYSGSTLTQAFGINDAVKLPAIT